MNAQRALAVLLTILLFGLVIFGLGALFALFDHRSWGYVAGVLTCAVMVAAGINAARKDGSGGPGGQGGPTGRPGAKGPGNRPGRR